MRLGVQEMFDTLEQMLEKLIGRWDIGRWSLFGKDLIRPLNGTIRIGRKLAI
jgi:hypothetical protein